MKLMFWSISFLLICTYLFGNENGDLSAIFETVLAHMDLNARKVTEFSEEKLNKLIEYMSSNKLTESLPFELKLKIRDL